MTENTMLNINDIVNEKDRMHDLVINFHADLVPTLALSSLISRPCLLLTTSFQKPHYAFWDAFLPYLNQVCYQRA